MLCLGVVTVQEAGDEPNIDEVIYTNHKALLGKEGGNCLFSGVLQSCFLSLLLLVLKWMRDQRAEYVKAQWFNWKEAGKGVVMNIYLLTLMPHACVSLMDGHMVEI